MPSPSAILERQLREAIVAALHELVPEFQSHVQSCPNCGKFHDWVRWRHQEHTSEWHAECPDTGQRMILPLEFRTAAHGW